MPVSRHFVAVPILLPLLLNLQLRLVVSLLQGCAMLASLARTGATIATLEQHPVSFVWRPVLLQLTGL